MSRYTRRGLTADLSRVFVVALVATSSLGLAPAVTAATTRPHVMVVLMENSSYEGVVGNSQMPYVNGLVAANGSVSTTDLSHPSLPNYLGLISGSIQDNPQDTTPQDGTYAGPQLTDELAAAGIGWKAYMQDMPQACDLTDQYSPGNYDVNHNPFMYFNSVRNNPSQCNSDVPYTQLTADLTAGTAPPFLWVSPNTINDMHDGTPAQGDSFLRGLVAQVQGSRWWTAGSRIVITWDEGEQSEQVLTLVVGSAHGTAASGGNEYGTLRGIEEAYGVGLLGHSADANVGDIRPLLAGSSTPPPPPRPSPVAPPSPTPTPVFPSVSPGPPAYVRGVFGKDSSPSGSALIAAAGFNTVMTDPYREVLYPLVAKGLKGIVWMGAWKNAPTCGFERDDATITSQVTPIAGHPAILAYYLGDEPRVSECPNAPAMFKKRSDLIHALDPGSLTFTVIQAYENGVSRDYAPWAGVVDILGFDVYPCARTSPTCTFGDIDQAVASIDKAGIKRYWGIVQDFQDCYYRLPAPKEIAGQFDRWARSDMSGYLVFSWSYVTADTSCGGTSLESKPDNVAQLKYENFRYFAPQPPTAARPSPVVNQQSWLVRSLPAAVGVVAGMCVALAWLLIRRRRSSQKGRQERSGGRGLL